MKIDAGFPAKLQCLFKPMRYKILYGGRGGAKSWGIARALLIKGTQTPLRILCAREFQNSLEDSVFKLLQDQVAALSLDGFYRAAKSKIVGANGTEFGFEGLRHNINSIKSYEGADICWVEEAHTVSRTSWDILIPTIRKEHSEIWMSFNPELEEDETYQRFVLHPPTNSFLVFVNWRDNPWFPEVLRQEMEDLRGRDHDAYLNVWEGFCKKNLEGAIYADELRQAQEQGRITSVPYYPGVPVDTFWDLGWADCTSVWFVQTVGKELHVIDFYQSQFKAIQHDLKVLQDRGYVLRTYFMPHDAKHHQKQTGKSIEELMQALGKDVRVLERENIQSGIEAARTVFPMCWFDQGKCADGLQALRRYRFEQDPNTRVFSKTPLHDENSHAADAFRYFAMGYSTPSNPAKRTRKRGGYRTA